MGGVEEGANNQEDTAGATLNNRRARGKPKNLKKLLFYLISTILVLIALVLLLYFLLRHFSETPSRLTEKSKLIPPNVEVPLPPSASVLHVFEKAAVCSDSDVCSRIGRDILHRGGNAVDAAIASLFCNGIATMQSLGIGGGFLMNVFIKSENRSYTINAREIAPLAATETMFVNNSKGSSRHGPLSIGVPGEVLGYWEAHKRFGSMTWRELIEPSIKVCEDGVVLSKHMSDSLHSNERIKNDPHLRASFIDPKTGEYHKIGKIIYPSKELCNTYRLLASNGGPDFYNGTIAKMLVEDLAEIGSIITTEDLKQYQIELHDSLAVPLRDDILHVVRPVGSGVLVAFILNILRGYNFTEQNLSNPKEMALTYHRFIEAYKLAFGLRSSLGDPRFTKNMNEVINNLTSIEHANAARQRIIDSRTNNDVKYYGAQFWSQNDNGTSHISILAQNGDAVSVTSTINYYFGSSHSGRQTGIIFNNVMDDFSTPGFKNYFGLPSSKSNFIRPGKRAMSSMAPTIITDKLGNVKLIIGSAGGTKIPTSVAWVIAQVLWFGQDIKQAIDAPRIHHQLIPNELEYEFGILQSVIDNLEARGHKTQRYHDRGSTMCGIVRNDTAVYANADFRKKGDVFGI